MMPKAFTSHKNANGLLSEGFFPILGADEDQQKLQALSKAQV